MTADRDSSPDAGSAGSPGAPAGEPTPKSFAAGLWKVVVGLSVLGFLALVIWLAGRGRTVTGSVSEAETGVPIGGATVAAAHGRTLTDDAGRFTLRIQGQPGVLTIVADGYESREIPWSEASVGGTLDVSLVPTPRRVLATWLDNWQRGNYGAMFERLAVASQAEISRNEFIHRVGALRLGWARVVRANQDEDQAEVGVELGLRGEGRTVSEMRTFTLLKEQGRWRIAWIPEPPVPTEP